MPEIASKPPEAGEEALPVSRTARQEISVVEAV